MNLARHSLTPTTPTQFIDARFDTDNKIFTTSTLKGYAVYSACPLRLLKKRELSNGTLAIVQPLHTTSLLFFVGGGRSPLYPPNKVIFWDEAQGQEVAELEFRERVRGLACRRGWLVVALRRRAVAFKFDSENGRPERWKEWETCDNPRGLIALATAPYSTLLVIPGLQIGHVHLIHLPPCPPPPQSSSQPSTARKRPAATHAHNPKEIIIAHESALTTLTVPPSGRILATTSSKGTLVRIWNSHTGNLARELRRGADRAEIFGVAFKNDESEICVWSDKGTIHVFRLGNVNEGGGNRQSALAPLSPFLKLHKYFESEWSYAHFRLPTPPPQIHLSNTTSVTAPKDELYEEERCVACWIEVPVTDPDDSSSVPTDTSRLKQSGAKAQSNQPLLQTPQKVEHQLIVVTYSGKWYRLALPSSSRPRSRSISTVSGTSSSTAGGTAVTAGETARSASPSLRKAALTTAASTSPKGKSRLQSYKPESGRGSGVGSVSTVREHDYKGKARDTGDTSAVASNSGSGSGEPGRRCTLVEFRKIDRWDGW